MLGAQQNAQHGFSGDLYSLQVGLLEFALNLSDLQSKVVNLSKKSHNGIIYNLKRHAMLFLNVIYLQFFVE